MVVGVAPQSGSRSELLGDPARRSKRAGPVAQHPVQLAALIRDRIAELVLIRTRNDPEREIGSVHHFRRIEVSGDVGRAENRIKNFLCIAHQIRCNENQTHVGVSAVQGVDGPPGDVLRICKATYRR